MREIKFKGKRVDNGKWIYGFYYRDGDGACIIETLRNRFDVIPESVGQFTGLKDSEGTEIYEGDILEFTDKWEWYRGQWFAKFAFASKEETIELKKEYDTLPMHRRVVEIGDDGVGFSLYDLREKRWKVVGNIIETPELIEIKK